MSAVITNGKSYSNAQDILAAVASKALTVEQASALLMAIKGPSTEKITVAVSDKSGVFTIRLGGRYPVCLYPNQVVRLLENLSSVLEQMASLDKADYEKCPLSEEQFRDYVRKYAAKVAK